MSQRTQRISALLRDAIQTVISRGLQDPRVRGLITVTKITTADDLSQSTVYVSIMPIEHADLTMHGLTAAAAHIRRQAGMKVKINRMPSLVFKLDTTSARQAGVLGALAQVTREREEREAAEQAAQGETPENAAPSEESSSDER